MAEPVVLVGEVLVQLLRESFVHLKPRARALLEHMRVAAEPPPGVSFQTEDGAAYSGLVVVDHNEVVVMLAARTEPTLASRPRHHERRPLTHASPAPGPPPQGLQRSFYSPDEPDDREWDEPPGYGRFK